MARVGATLAVARRKRSLHIPLLRKLSTQEKCFVLFLFNNIGLN